MLEHLAKLLVGSFSGDRTMITENPKGRENPQERFLVKNIRKILRDCTQNISEKRNEDTVRTLWRHKEDVRNNISLF